MNRRADFALSTEQKIDARDAMNALEGTGMSLTEAVRRALEGRRSVERATVAQVAEQFLRSRLTLRSATAAWYLTKVGQFSGEFGTRCMDDVTRADFRGWIKSGGHSAAMVRAVRAMYRWAIAHEPPLAGQDATSGVSGVPSRADEIGFLPVEDCGKIVAGAGVYRSALALMLFAGIRPGEIWAMGKQPLLWRCVNPEEKIIRVPAEVSKTGRARIMEGLPEAVWAWLDKPKRENDPVCPARSLQAIRLAQTLSGRGARGKDWPHDALLHTFATYHVAAFANPGQTAMLMGHEGNPTMLHRHYRGLATKAEAERFWALRPTP
jgi:integrase